MVATIPKTTNTNPKTKHSITAFRSPQNKPALKIKVTNIISSKNYLTLQLSRSVLHVSMNSRWRGEFLMFLRGLESPETLLNFTSPLHCPSNPPPPLLLQSVDLTSSSGEPGEHKGVVGKNSAACQLFFYDSLNFILHLKNFQIPKLKLVLYNGSSLLIM